MMSSSTNSFYLVIWLALTLFAGPAFANEKQEPSLQPDDEARDLATEEDDSWTWFGMGYENRHRRRRMGEDFSFGPERRPAGGFGTGAQRGRRSDSGGGTGGHNSRGGRGSSGARGGHR